MIDIKGKVNQIYIFDVSCSFFFNLLNAIFNLESITNCWHLLSVERDSRGHRDELRGVQADRGGPQRAGQGHRLNQAHGHAKSLISE